MQERIDNLTGVRAFAALWVLSLHISVMSFSDRLGRLIGRGALGVDIFFVLSGLVLSMVYAGNLPSKFSWPWYRRFVSRRFAKIYPLHLITFLLAVAIVLTGRHYGHHLLLNDRENTLFAGICNVLMLNACGLTPGSWNTPSWSVGAEWFAYTLLFAPMVYFLRGVRIVWIMACTIVIFALLFLSIVATHRYNAAHLLTGAGVVRITPEFIAGYGLYRWTRNSPQGRGDVWMLCGGLGLLLICFGPTFGYVLVLPAIMLLLRGARQGGPWTDRLFGNRAAVLTGEASYSIYLTHYFVIETVNALVHHFHVLSAGPGIRRGPLVALGELFAAIAVGYASFRYVEEPLRQRLVRFFAAGGPRNPEEITPPNLPGLERDTEVAATIS